MRISIAAFCFATLVLATRTAGAGQSHYLLAKAFNNFLNSKVVMPPDLTPTAEATYELGIGGDPVSVANHALVDSDQGLLLLTSSAAQELGLTQIAPADWALAVRLEESAMLGKPAPSSIRVTLVIEMSGMVGSLARIHQLATLDVNGCSMSASRDLSMTGATNLVSSGGCNLAAIQGRVEGSELIVDIQNPKTALLIEAQLDETISYANAFSGQFETFQRGRLKIETAGGSLIFKSPTFLTKAEGAGDGGTPTTNADAGGTDGGPSDAAAGEDATSGAGDAAAGGGSDAASAGGGGGGCSVGAAASGCANRWPSGFAGILGAAALALRARRRK